MAKNKPRHLKVTMTTTFGMFELKRMLPFWVLIILFLLLIKKTEGTINASIDHFYMHCGSRSTVQMDIIYNNSNYQNIASIYTNNKPIECSFTANGTIFNITDTRKRGCALQDLTSPYLSYHAVVFLQEDRWFQRVTDPKFLLSCVYTSGDVKVRTSPINILDNTWNVQDYRWNVVRGYVDMNYQLGIYEDDGIFDRPILQAQFGQNIALKVSMSGTDSDEKGIRVRECVAKSGGMEAQFITNYCSSSAILPSNAGFISNCTTAFLPGLEAFRLAGSEDLTVTFECLVDVCADNCDGVNCRSHIRTRRDIWNIKRNISQIQAFGKINIVGINKQYTSATENWCINQLEFIVPIACLSCLLSFTLYALVCILIRRHKTSTAKVTNVE